MALKQADRIESNNPSAYGVVKAIEVSGHKSVKNLDELYKIADCILSDSKKNTNNDAIGQTWYVVENSCNYRLIDWNTRKNSTGWKRVDSGDIEKAIANLKAEILGEVSEECNTLGKIESKINALRESLKVTDVSEGLGTTIENNSGVVKVNISVDEESIKFDNEGKLTINSIDGGIY